MHGQQAVMAIMRSRRDARNSSSLAGDISCVESWSHPPFIPGPTAKKGPLDGFSQQEQVVRVDKTLPSHKADLPACQFYSIRMSYWDPKLCKPREVAKPCLPWTVCPKRYCEANSFFPS